MTRGPFRVQQIDMAQNVDVINNEQKSRFENETDGRVSVAEYELRPGAIVFTHTEVPQELSGRGIAQQLVRTALEHARSQNLRVVPLCAYVQSFIQRHPEYQDLVGE